MKFAFAGRAAAECRVGQCPVWMAPALQDVFCDCDGLSVQSCVRPVCVAIATGPDEFRKQGSYRLNDLGGRDIGRSVLTVG